MVVSLTRMLKSFGQAQDDLPTLAANNAQEIGASQHMDNDSDNVDIHHNNDGTQSNHERAALTPPERVDRIRDALAQVNDIHSSTPLTHVNFCCYPKLLLISISSR